MTGMEQTRTHARELQSLIRAYRRSQVLITCTELGVFRALSAGARDVASLATGLGADAPALARLLNTATALGLLARDGDRYANTPATDAVLGADGAGYLGNLFARENAFYDRWGRLAEAVRSGRRPEPNRKMEDAGDWVRDFEYALYDLARLHGPPLAAALDLDPARDWRVLDVGGGHGGYSVALARRYPRLRATVLDLPPVIPVAGEIVGATGVADRIALVAGDFMEAPLGEDYDLALLFGVLISEPPERRRVLLRRIRDALRPGGRLVLREFVMEEDGSGSPDALLFDLQMLLSTESGGAISGQTLRDELREAGFGPIEIRPVPDMNPLWLAEKG